MNRAGSPRLAVRCVKFDAISSGLQRLGYCRLSRALDPWALISCRYLCRFSTTQRRRVGLKKYPPLAKQHDSLLSATSAAVRSATPRHGGGILWVLV